MQRQKLRKRENGGGSVYKRSDIVHRPWYAVTPAQYDAETGKTARETIGHYATRAAAAGVRKEDIIRMMGHTDYKVDVDSYIKQEASTLVKAIEKMQ